MSVVEEKKTGCGTIFTVGSLLAGAWWFFMAAPACERRWENSSVTSRYKFPTGCQVLVGRDWIPDRNFRVGAEGVSPSPPAGTGG